MRPVIQLAYAFRRRVLGALRWPTRGVKVAAYDAAGAILLIRNTYGRSDLWVLPGGGVGRGEDYAAAAVREVREETGLVLTAPRRFARYRSATEGKRDTIELFVGQVTGELVIDPREVAEVAFFAPDALPAQTSPATRRRLTELAGTAAVAPYW